MKNECSIVRDILPLYFENMVSEETSAFVKEHLENCSECAAELEAIKAGKQIDEAAASQNANDAGALTMLKKKIRKKKLIAVALTAACLLVAVSLLHFFPIYRIIEVGGTSYFNSSEVAKLAYIGSGTDRAEAQSILRQADAAFHDCKHTSAENEELYGLLSRYATDTDRWNDVSFVNHSLELWSAHLDDTEGYIWVYYSYEAINSAGQVVSGSKNIPSLWTVEKDNAGEWIVTSIKEHP